MSEITLTLRPETAADKPSGHVASFRLPIPVSAMKDMDRCIILAYGEGCVMTEEPKGWLKISTKPEQEAG